MGRVRSFHDLGCLVTGASAGIGHEVARLLAAEGARLVVTARRTDRLEELKRELEEGGAAEVHVVTADLARREDVTRLADESERLLGHVDVLINNAGFAVPGRFDRSKVERTLAMIDVNVVATTLLFRRLLPGMLSRDRGGVLNVASVAGLLPAPYQASYAATKAYVVNLSLSAYQEVKHTSVAVVTLCPGVTDTEFFDAAGYRHLGKFMERRMPAERVARDGIEGLKRGQMLVVPGFSNRLLLLVSRLTPRSLVGEVSRRLMGGRSQKS